MPCSDRYERSYMHRDDVSHVAVTKTDFIITASCDGHVKFWKKMDLGIEFVKHFRLVCVKKLIANNVIAMRRKFIVSTSFGWLVCIITCQYVIAA